MPPSHKREGMQTTAMTAVDAHFSKVFEEGFDYVWVSLRRLGVPEKDAEDVAHDVFLEVFRKLESYDSGRPLKPWLFAFAFRFASAYRRRSGNRRELLGQENTEAVSAERNAEEQHLQNEQRQFLAEAISMVAEERRAVFVLHELDQIEMQDIADSQGIPLFTAYSRLRVARQEFKEAAMRLMKRKEWS